MNTVLDRDVLLVCLGGHVITDVLISHPEQGSRHCERCGAPTISRCPTCGDDIPGATALPGLATLGQRPAPRHCPGCGAAFPWADHPLAVSTPDTLGILEPVLRRLPHAARQLRDRHNGRPTLRVADEYDLQDLLRAMLHLHFLDVHRETRTPGYSSGTRTDFLVGPERVALTAKLARPGLGERELVAQIHEDVAYYERLDCGCLIVLICDPEQVVRQPRWFEAAYPRASGLDMRCIVTS